MILLLLACYGDVSIMKRTTEEVDTGTTVIVEDSPQPSWEPAGETSYDTDNRSGITGYTYLRLRQVACPACMGETQEISINFRAIFHQPSTDGHTEWIPPNGQCTTNMISVSPSTVPIDLGLDIYVDSGYHTFTADNVGLGIYENNRIWESQLERDTRYDVFTDEGNYSFVSTHGFDFIEPYTMLWVDPSYAFEAPIYRSGATFTWGPTSTDSIFMITVAVYSWDGSQFLGYVTCLGPDNGSMTIPSQYLINYNGGSLAAIHLARHKIQLVETNINNSYIETHMEWEVVGTGTIY